MKKVCIITNGGSTINFRGELIKALQNKATVHVVFPFVASPKDKVALEVMGVHCHDLMLSQQGKNIKQELIAYRHLKTMLNMIKADVVLNYTIKPIIWGSLAASACGIKNIYSVVPGRGRMLKDGGVVKGFAKENLFSLI